MCARTTKLILSESLKKKVVGVGAGGRTIDSLLNYSVHFLL